MARKSRHQVANLAAVDGLLRDLPVYPIDDHTADIYGTLKAALVDRFGPKERARRRQFDIASLGFSENDLWIAAIARQRRLTLVTADSDIARLRDVEPIAVESWWSP